MRLFSMLNGDVTDFKNIVMTTCIYELISTAVRPSLKSNRKAMNRNWSNKTKTGNKYYIQTKDNENIWPTERAAIYQKVATQQPKPN